MSTTTIARERQTAVFRQASLSDLDAILAVEQSWDEQGRANAETFLTRMQRFPQGFFVGCVQHGSEEPIVATVTSMPIRHNPQRLDTYKNWDSVTNGGKLFDRVNLADCNGLYIVSGIVDAAWRGHNVFAPGITAQLQLAARLGFRYVLAGAVIPGYRHHCEKHGETDAWTYCTTRRGSHLIDPLLSMYEALGFGLSDRRQVVPEYFPDYGSRNYAALVMRDLAVTPL